MGACGKSLKADGHRRNIRAAMLSKRAVVSTDLFRLSATARLITVAAVASLAAACSPYPDDGEFLAGVVYAQNFIPGVKTIDRLRAVGNKLGDWPKVPYTVFATTRSGDTTAKVSSTFSGTSPFWTDGKRNPLDITSVGQVYFFDGPCTATSDEPFDERLDLIRKDRQYPLFADIPELLSANSGKPGRKGNYSAVVEVIHLSAPSTLPCQSVKRFDTATGRIGKDLTVVSREYRLYQVVDPALTPNTAPPARLPVQLGFYNQLIVPYLDMGPVPLATDGKTFVTMPLYKVYKEAAPAATATPIQIVVPGVFADLPKGTYSPICEERVLTGQAVAPPPDGNDAAYKNAKANGALLSCLPCQTVTVDASGVPTEVNCPFASSQVAGN